MCDTLAWQSVCEECQGDNKLGGLGGGGISFSVSSPPLSSPPSACQSFLIRRTAKVACLQNMAYFRALTQNGNELNFVLCERLSDFN